MFQNLSTKYSKKGPFSPYFAIGFCFDNPILDPMIARIVYNPIPYRPQLFKELKIRGLRNWKWYALERIQRVQWSC